MAEKNKKEWIKIRGAKEHNLKNIDVDIPRNELVVLTGLSGSGKSSLAFDTIYAEGQRRYMESLSSYARMFLGQMEKPDVEKIEGLSPAISIDQKSTNRNPRSTVGTVTEIYDYFRLLYARIGIPHCPNCGRPIARQTVDQMVDQILALPEGTKIQLLAPVVRGRKGEHAKVLERAKRSGYVRVRIDGNLYDLSEEIKLEKNIKHNIEIVVDRLVVKDGITARLTDSVENTLALAEGLLIVDVIGGEPMTFSQSFSCPDCGISVSEIEPRSFSFNNPFGACPDCFGLGYKMEFDVDLMIPDKELSINQGAIVVTGVSGSGKSSLVNEILYKHLAKKLNRARTIPGKHKGIKGVEQLDKVIAIDQSPIGRTPRSNPATYTGVFDQIRDLFAATSDAKAKGYSKGRFSFNVKGGRCEACSGDGIIKIEMHFLPDVYVPCEVCGGKRYNRETLDVKYKGKSIYDVLDMTVEEALPFFENVPSIRRKIETLNDVGLSYVKLGQPSTELSGGEAQRIKLATELSRRSTGKTIYILDEPTTGLHFADVQKLVEILQKLTEGGNTVVVIEHNLDVIKTADYIIDIGPEGGDGGGTVIAKGTPEEVAANPASYTGKYIKKML